MTGDLPDTFTEAGVEFVTTKEAKVAVTDIAFVRKPERAAELDDTVRVNILQILREGVPDKITTTTKDDVSGDTIIRQRDVTRHALSVVEIVKMSIECEGCDEVTKNQVYHHLPKLIEHGFVIKFGTATKGKRTTDYYRRTSMGFVVTTGVRSSDVSVSVAKKKSVKYVDKLIQTFDLKLSEDEKTELAKLWVELYLSQQAGRLEVLKLLKRDVADKHVLELYETLVQVFSLGSDESVRIYRRIRELIFSER